MTTLANRILDCFPSGSYALTGLLRVIDVVESDQVPTAAVECRLQPRLLINPEFVARHAETPEKLLMLVMHELHHVLLGHTTLFPTATPVQNFVFDCVINALISRMFPSREHLEFLTGYYDDARFPECLLRPPPGWWRGSNGRMPRAIAKLPAKRRKSVWDLHRSLYSVVGATYQEVFEALPKVLDENVISAVPLLGGHGPDGALAGSFEARAPVLVEAVREIVEEWPQPPDPIRGRSLSDLVETTSVPLRRVPSNRVILRALLRKVTGDTVSGSVRRVLEQPLVVQSVIPGHDRRAAVLHALGARPLLYARSVPQRRPHLGGERTHIYADVSGSMKGFEGALYGAVHDCRAWVHPTIHLFSTRIADVSLAELARGLVRTDGGTAIACVARHMTEHKVRRACILTDGWVGSPRGDHHAVLAQVRLGVAYLGASVNTDDLSAVANHVAHLNVTKQEARGS